MRAAVTNIPHLLYEENLLKTRKWYVIFIYKIWFMYNDMMGMGEKTPKNIHTRKKTRKKFPIWFPSHRPVYKIGGRLFSGSKETGNKPDAMGRQRREGWLQHCPLSYDQARCSHPPFAECYAIQAFSIASDFDPQLMPKIQNQITMRKVCIVI